MKDSSTLRDGAFFHNSAYISGESDRILMQIVSQMCTWTRKSLLNFVSNLVGGRMRSLTAVVNNVVVLSELRAGDTRHSLTDHHDAECYKTCRGEMAALVHFQYDVYSVLKILC